MNISNIYGDEAYNQTQIDIEHNSGEADNDLASALMGNSFWFLVALFIVSIPCMYKISDDDSVNTENVNTNHVVSNSNRSYEVNTNNVLSNSNRSYEDEGIEVEAVLRRSFISYCLEVEVVQGPAASSAAEQSLSPKSGSIDNGNTPDRKIRDLETGGATPKPSKEIEGDGDDDDDDDDEDPELLNPTDERESFRNSNSNKFSLVSSWIQSFRSGSKQRPQEDCCSICLEAYVVGDRVAKRKRKPPNTTTTTTTTTTPVCHHRFHEDCIMEWLQDHDECPLCRVNMISDERNPSYL